MEKLMEQYEQLIDWENDLESRVTKNFHGVELEVFEIIVQNIVTFVIGGVDKIVFSDLRECIYDLFVYDTNIHLSIWSILSRLINESYIDEQNIDACIEQTFELFKLYNNNYRPIYHVERYLYKLISLIHNNIPKSCENKVIDSTSNLLSENPVI